MLHLIKVYALFDYGICHILSWYVPLLIMVYTIINLFAPFGTPQINDIHFKYIWASGRGLRLTSVAHLRKRLS